MDASDMPVTYLQYMQYNTPNGKGYVGSTQYPKPWGGDAAAMVIAKGLFAPPKAEGAVGVAGVILAAGMAVLELARFGMELASLIPKKDNTVQAKSLSIEIVNSTDYTLVFGSQQVDYSKNPSRPVWTYSPKIIGANEKVMVQLVAPDGNLSGADDKLHFFVHSDAEHSVPVSIYMGALIAADAWLLANIDGCGVKLDAGKNGFLQYALPFEGNEGYPSFVLSWSNSPLNSVTSVTRNVQITPFRGMPKDWVLKS